MTTAETNPVAPVNPALDVDPVYEITLWVATCSNNSRTVAECGAFTDAPHSATVDRKSTRLNSSHVSESRMPSSA